MTMQIGDDLSLIEPDFHDGFLRGILVDANDNLTLTCSDGEKGKTYQIKVPNIEYLYAENFRQGNIIFNIYFFVGSQSSTDLLRKASGMGDPQFQAAFESLVKRVSNERWLTINIIPSYGCDLIGVAKCSLDSVVIAPYEGNQ